MLFYVLFYKGLTAYPYFCVTSLLSKMSSVCLNGSLCINQHAFVITQVLIRHDNGVSVIRYKTLGSLSQTLEYGIWLVNIIYKILDYK